MIKMFPKNAIKKPLLNNKGWSLLVLCFIYAYQPKYARLRTIFYFMTDFEFKKNSNLISRRPQI